MRSTITTLILLILAPQLLWGQSSDQLPELTKELNAIAENALEQNQIPGMSVAVSFENQLVYSGAFGLADVENNVPANVNTRFRTASIAKPITAVAILKLVEQGKVKLDSPIQTYCPDFPVKKWEVTPRQLLGHVSGVRHYNKPGESTGKQFFPTLSESLSLFKEDPLLFEPASKFSYTTFGYTLLGCAVENASEMLFEDFLTKELFEPSGMKSTGLDNTRQIISNRSRGYMLMTPSIHQKIPESIRFKYNVDEIYNATLHDTSMKVPGGGLLSTAEDLIRFVVALNDNKLIKKQTRELMWTRQTLTNGEATNYGLGWKLEQDQGGPLLISHSGSQAGTSTFLVVIPKFDLAVAVMCNLEGVSAKSISRNIGMATLKILRK